MTTGYPLGTVAWADIDGVSAFKVMHIGTATGTAWAHTQHDGTGQVLASGDRVTNIRPLVELDLADFNIPEMVSRLREAGQNWLADQIETQTKRPRIPEPGLWGVVEATGPHGRFQAVRWIERGTKDWLDASGTWIDWDDLVDPVEIRAGIEGGAA